MTVGLDFAPTCAVRLRAQAGYALGVGFDGGEVNTGQARLSLVFSACASSSRYRPHESMRVHVR